MAGRGQRFIDKGFRGPKPLIDVIGKPMIQRTLESLNLSGNYTFIILSEQEKSYDRILFDIILDANILGRFKIVNIDEVLAGQALTVLEVKPIIDNDEELLIVNSDNYFIYDKEDFLETIKRDDIDGLTFTFDDKQNRTHWSFAEVDENNLIKNIKEKEPISKHCLCGAFYWKRGSDFVKYTEQMIEKNINHNSEFYIGPVYNEAIQDGKKILNYHIENMLSMGTPEELSHFSLNI